MLKNIYLFTKRYNKTFLIALSLYFLILVIIIFITSRYFHKTNTFPKSLEEYTSSILNECQNGNNRDYCYSNKITQLTDSPTSLSMEDAFKVIQLILEKNPSYAYCHVLAHELGAREARKDLTKWKDVVTRCPMDLCSGGCSHGVLMEKYKAESLNPEQIETIRPELASICLPRENWNPSRKDIYNCVHGLGHLGMYITNANIPRSIEICEDIGKKGKSESLTENCIGGIFMQIFQPIDPDDMILIQDIAPQKNRASVNEFCNKYTGIPNHACHRESWTYFWDEISTPEGLTNHCGYTTDYAEQIKCYRNLMDKITKDIVFRKNDLLGITTFCSKLLPQFQAICSSQAVLRIIEVNKNLVDKAVFVCEEANKTSTENGEKCRETLVNYASWSYEKNSPEYKSYCSKLPDPLAKKCLTQN